MISAVSTVLFGAMLLASTSTLSAKDEAAFAKCLWEKAPSEAETIVSTKDEIAFMQALIKGGAACGHAEAGVDIDRFAKAVHDARPKDLSRPKDSSNGRTK
ncbi:hypothetical protein [Sphingopyxis sp.]|uniref:hypothetical protein n=1 Tax=Sphingopyxis sp. TaxID=1908224 RepID=UPI002ED8B548